MNHLEGNGTVQIVVCRDAAVTAARHTHVVPLNSLEWIPSLFGLLGKKARNNSVLGIVLDLYVPGSLSSCGYDGPRLLHDC